MNGLKSLLRGSRVPRGMSNTASIVIALVVMVVGWSLIRSLLGMAFVLLRWAIEIGVLIVVVLLIAWVIKSLAKKME
ncbi:MAG: hypothetical protein ABSE73_32345 [Planctomycetota bacterium]